MNTGPLIPFFEGGKNIIGYPFQPRPIEILLLREILLIAVLAAEVAKVGDVPLEIERFSHPKSPIKIQIDLIIMTTMSEKIILVVLSISIFSSLSV